MNVFNFYLNFIFTKLFRNTTLFALNHNYIRNFISFIRKLIIIILLQFYGIILISLTVIKSFHPIINKFFVEENLNFLLQGTICCFFPTYTPWCMFSIYFFAYRVELLFLILENNKTLRKEIIIILQSMRRSPIKIINFMGRTGASGFMGGTPRMPGGNPQGMAIWGFVVVSSVALNQYRLYRQDVMQAENEAQRNRMRAENEAQRDRMRAENEAQRDRMQAENELHKIHFEASNKRPWWKSKPPDKPTY